MHILLLEKGCQQLQHFYAIEIEYNWKFVKFIHFNLSFIHNLKPLNKKQGSLLGP